MSTRSNHNKKKRFENFTKELASGVLGSAFAKQALYEYSKQVIANKKQLLTEQKTHEKWCKENGNISLMNNDVWLEQAESIIERVDAFDKS